MFDQWLKEHRGEITDSYVALRLEMGDSRPEEALRRGAEFGVDVSIKSVLGEMGWDEAITAGAKNVLATGGSLETLSETARSLFLAIREVLEKDRPAQAFEWLGIVGDYTLLGSETVAKVMEENLEQRIGKQKQTEDELERAHDRLEERVGERTRELEKVNQSLQQEVLERKHAEEALKESEERFRTLFDRAGDLMFIHDDQGRFLQVNKEVCRVLGYSRDELLGMTPMDIHPSEEAAEVPGRMEELLKTGGIVFESCLVGKDGQRTPVEIKAKLVDYKKVRAVLSVARDITDRRHAQQVLEESERKYRTIFDTAGTAMIIFGDDRVITLANDEWVKLADYSKEETEGKLTWTPFFTEESLAKMAKYHKMRSEDPDLVPKAYEAQFVDRQGGIHDGIININMVPGTLQRVASFQDLTELKRAQQQMYRADKMAALGQIIAGVAHEINNPNNFIYFNIPILKKYIEAMEPLLEHHLKDEPDLRLLNMPYKMFLEDVFKLLENMEHGSQRITGIVSELKNYIRSDEAKDMKIEQLKIVIDQVMALIGKQVRKMVKSFDIDIAEDLKPVKINPGKIEQVLINLVINAGQAADKDDSWVKLGAHCARDDDKFIEIVVEDNGTGVPKESLDQIFEPFFTSKSCEAGTGLGLSISHQIIEEHGGTIDVESELGKGTCFTVRLPVV